MVSTYNTLGVAPVYFEFGGANSTSEQFIVKGITGLSSDIPIALNSPIRSGSGNIRQATPSLNNPETVTIQFLLTPERELFNWYQAATNDPQSLANRREVAISAYDSITGNLTRLEIRDAVPVNYEVVYDPTSGKAYETLTLSYQDFTTVPGLMNSSSPATVTSSPVYFKFDSPIINAKLILDINGLSLENRIGSSQTISSGKGTIKQRQATPNNQKLEPIVIKSLLTPERDLFNWYQATSSSLNGSQSFQPVEIYAIDGSTGQGIAQWNLTNAIPIAYEVNYDANGLAYETLTLAHQGIERSAPTTIPSSPLPNFDPNNANTLFNLSPTYLTFNTDITAETLIAEITGLRVESNNSSANKAIGSGKPGNKQRQATPTIQKFEPVTLKSSLTSGLDLYNWYQLTNNTNGLQSNQRNVGISAYDATNNNKVAGWNLINATPIGYEVNYSWDTGKAYESVKLAYQGLDAVSGNNNISNSGSLFGSPNPNNLNNSPSVFFEFSSGLTSTKLIGEISGLSLESSIASQLLIGSGRGGNKMLQTIPTTEQYDPLIIQSFLTSETDLFNWYKVSNDPTSVPQQFRQPLTISARDRHTGSLLAQWQVVNPHTSGYQANYDYQIGKSYETLTLVHEGIVRVDNPVDYGSTINPRDLLNIAPTYLKFNTGVTSERLIASVTGLSVETRIASQAAPTLHKYETIEITSFLTPQKDLYDWFINSNTNNGWSSNRQTLNVSAYDATNNSKVAEWQAINSFASAYELSYDGSSGKAYETIELVHEGVHRKDLLTGSNSNTIFGNGSPSNINNLFGIPDVFFQFDTTRISPTSVNKIDLRTETLVSGGNAVIGSGKGGVKVRPTNPTMQFEPLVVDFLLTPEHRSLNWWYQEVTNNINNNPTTYNLQPNKDTIELSAYSLTTGSLIGQWQVFDALPTGYEVNLDPNSGQSYETLTFNYQDFARII